MKVAVKSIDDYLALQPEKIMLALEKLRQIIRDTAPQAEEIISYGMPAFKYHGNLVYFAAFKKHCSFFPGNGSMVKELKKELKDFDTTPGSIHFTVEKPLPTSLIKKIVKTRMKQNLEKEKTKLKATKKTKK